MGKYQTAYDESIRNPEKFWGEAGNEIVWEKKFTKVLDDSNKPFYRWFPDGVLNTCYNAVDYHVENGRGDQAAIIYDSPMTGTKQKITYKEFLSEVSKFAGALKSLGAEKGDRVIIYMPMIPHASMATAACGIMGM